MSSKTPSCSYSSSSSSSFEFEVFLSFRGEDTRKGFAGHLHEALYQRGIKTFLDEESLERGESIKDRILSAIEGSAVCIPILSPSYADSRWCLMELAKMVECRKKIIPIFYHVDPSDVRHQRGAFEAAFQSYQLRFDRSTVMEWRKALREAADISGYDLRNVANGNEAALIRLIVDRVSQELIYGPYDLTGMSGSSPGYMAIQNQMKRQQEQWLMKFAEDMRQMPVLGAPVQQYSPGMEELEKVVEQQREQYLKQFAEQLKSTPLSAVQTQKTPGMEAIEKVVQQQSEQFLLQFAEEMRANPLVGCEPRRSPAMETAEENWEQQLEIYRKQFDQLIKQQQREQHLKQSAEELKSTPFCAVQTQKTPGFVAIEKVVQQQSEQFPLQFAEELRASPLVGGERRRSPAMEAAEEHWEQQVEIYRKQIDQLIKQQQEQYLAQVAVEMKPNPCVSTNNGGNQQEEQYLKQLDQLIRQQQERYSMQLDGTRPMYPWF